MSLKNKTRNKSMIESSEIKNKEHVFGFARIFASKNNTFVHITDLSGKETLARVTGGMKAKKKRTQEAAIKAAEDASQRCKELGITAVHIKLRGTGGTKTKSLGPGAQYALKIL